MRVIFVMIAIFLAFYLYQKESGIRLAVASKSFQVDSNFKIEIQPIFKKHCTPCHFQGGRMYERLPFDVGQTIINNEAGILRRIKDENEKMLIRKYIAESKHPKQ